MRVLVLSRNFPNPLWPYSGIFVLDQIKALQALGVDAVPIAPVAWAPRALRFWPRVRKYGVIPRRDQQQGVCVEHPPILVIPHEWPLCLSGYLYYKGCRELVARRAREGGFDLIHAHRVIPDGVAAALLGRELNIPVVCTAHGSDVNEYPERSVTARRTTQWALKHFQRLITVSDRLRQRVVELGGERHVEVVYNGADSALFQQRDRMEARKRLQLPTNRRIIVFVGRLTRVKAIPTLLTAIRKMRSGPCHLYLVGGGELRDELVRLASELGIADRCTFVGDQPHEKIPDWLSAADCLVLCSTSEGFPAIIPETMMCHTPIVATRVGGIPEIVRDGETGLLVPPSDAFSLTHAIEQMLTDEDLRERIKSRAGSIAKANFTWAANAKKTLAIYEDAVAAFVEMQNPARLPHPAAQTSSSWN